MNFLRCCFVLTLLFVSSVAARAETRVLLIGIESAGDFEARMWVPFGSTADLAPGTAHLLEHLKFKSNHEQGLIHIEGISGVSYNAETGTRYTRFDLGIPRRHLGEGLAALANIPSPLEITDEQLKTEKIIVDQELLQRTTSDPDGPFLRSVWRELYKGTPLEREPGGTEESIAAITMPDVLAFDKAHYAKTDQFLVIAGPPASFLEKSLIRQTFATSVIGEIHIDLKRQVTRDDAALATLPAFLAPLQLGMIEPSLVEKTKTSAYVRSTKVFYNKLMAGPTDWKSLVAGQILERGIDSRLPEGLTDVISEEAGLVQNFNFNLSPAAAGVWEVSFAAQLAPGVHREAVLTAFEKYMAEFSKTGLSQTSFDRLKKRATLYDEWEDAERRILSLAQDTVAYGYGNAVGLRETSDQLTLKDTVPLAEMLAAPGRVAIGTLVPKEAEQ